VLDSSDPALAADAATALGKIGDRQAIPQLTFLAASASTPPAVRSAAQAAIADLTGRSFATQPNTPIQVLTAAAWRYHRHQIEIPTDPVAIWTWDDEHKTLGMKEVQRSQAEVILGLQVAQEALRLSPRERQAQVIQLSLMLESALQRVGFAPLLAQDQAALRTMTTYGPAILEEVLKAAIDDGKTDLAAVAATVLARVTDRTALSRLGQPHPLVNALFAPGRRLQFAAAKALVTLAPTQPFPGSSRVVPTLARFVINQTLPRAVVIDGNPNRGSHLAGFLTNLGYDAELELTGNRGFLAAAESADVELILISYDLFREGWGLNDTLANLRADARTAAIPLFIYGPRNLEYMRPNLEHDYPGIRFLVQPVDAGMLQQQLKIPPVELTEAERTGYAREATMYLAQIAREHSGPLVADLPAVEPVLASALNSPATALSAAEALGDIADPDAQRSLAGILLDRSRDLPLRRQAAAQLTHSIRRFGRLITAGQEAQLVTALRDETDVSFRDDLMTILRALRPGQPAGSTRLLLPATPRTGPAARQTRLASPQPGSS
jgi:hypothetical protein